MLSTVLILCLVSLCATQNPEFILQAGRMTTTSNIVQLRCITDTLRDVASTSAVFFLNETTLEGLGIRSTMSGDGILILVDRETEGSYSCALPFDPRTSNTITLVALPDNEVPLFPRTFFAEVGSTAELNCSITPGRLLRQYFVTWQNGTSGSVYRDIPPIGLPTTPVATPPDPRYSIDPVTFSLSIANVQLSDSDSSYRCVLGLRDPRSNSIFTYERTQSTDLQLIIHKPPRITQPPSPATISLADTRQAIFNCTAVGDPAPKITWRHNGMDTTSPLMYHVNEATPTSAPGGEGFISLGTLAIFSLEEEDSGIVECIASVVGDEETTGGVEVPRDMEETQLAILGGFQNLDVLITQDGDVIYKLRLRGRMNTPVNLLFIYTRIGAQMRGEGEASVVNRTSLATFNATDRISNIEFSSQVPFRRFQVGVALMSGFTIGPINQSARNFDVSEPSLVLFDSMKLTILVAAAVPVAALILLVITAITVICIVAVHKHKIAEIKFQKKVIGEAVRVIEVLSKNVPPERAPEFLEYATMIYLRSCQVCRGSDSIDGGRSKEEGEDCVDGEGAVEELHVSQESDAVASQLLESSGSILKSCLDNPRISRQMTSNIVAELVSRGVPGVAPPPAAASASRGLAVGAVNPLVATTTRRAVVGGESEPLLLSSGENSLGYSSSSTASTSAHSESAV